MAPDFFGLIGLQTCLRCPLLPHVAKAGLYKLMNWIISGRLPLALLTREIYLSSGFGIRFVKGQSRKNSGVKTNTSIRVLTDVCISLGLNGCLVSNMDFSSGCF